MELVITGRVIDAMEAHRIGLVNEIVPKGQSARALELANLIAELPQPGIHADKEAAVRGFGETLRDGLRIEATCFIRSIFNLQRSRDSVGSMNAAIPIAGVAGGTGHL